MQDGFITLFTKLGSYKGDGSFEGWARRIFVTTALMALRKKDALKMSDELEAVRGMKTEVTSQVENIGYKELMELVIREGKLVLGHDPARPIIVSTTATTAGV